MTDLVAYPLPKISNSDVVNGVSELLHLDFNESNLTKPDPSSVRHLYEKLVETFIGVSLETYSDPSFNDYTSFEYPNLHEESVVEVTFLRYLFKIMDAAGINFKLSDLYSPTFGRTKKILTALINFGRYRLKKLHAFNKVNNERLDLIEQHNNIDDQLISAQEELINLKSTISTERPKADELKKSKHEVLDKIQTLNETQANTSATIEDIKEQNEILKERIAKYRDQKKDLEERKARLKMRILENPDQSLHELEDLRILCEKEKLALLDSEKRRKDATGHLDNINVIHKRMRKCLDRLNEILHEIDKNNEEKNNIKEYKTSILEMDNMLRDLMETRKHTEMKIQKFEEKITRITLQNKESAARQKIEMEDVNKQKMEREKRNALASKKIKEIELKLTMLENEDANNYKSHQLFVNGTQRKLNQLMAQIKWYHNVIINGMETGN